MKLFKSNFKLVLVALTLGLMLPAAAVAQESNLGNWLVYIGSKQVNDKWNIHHEVQYRNYNGIGDLEQLLLRTGLGKTFNEGKNNFLVGYGFIRSENYQNTLLTPESENKLVVNEHRLFQQFTAKNSIGKISLGHRYRFEQRFVEDVYKMRFRYFLSLKLPLDIKDNKDFYLSAYNEIFLNTESAVFDRNRVYSGLGYAINKNIRVELGYMNQLFESASRDQINIIAFVNF